MVLCAYSPTIADVNMSAKKDLEEDQVPLCCSLPELFPWEKLGGDSNMSKT